MMTCYRSVGPITNYTLHFALGNVPSVDFISGRQSKIYNKDLVLVGPMPNTEVRWLKISMNYASSVDVLQCTDHLLSE